MKSTEAAAKDRQSEDTAMSKILQKRIRDREPRFGIVFSPVVHALARAPRLEILSVLGAGWPWPRNLERRSEKTEMARPKREQRERKKAGERASGGSRKKRSPLPPRHETCTCSPRTCTQIICGKFEDEGFEIFRGRNFKEGKKFRKTEPKTHAENFGNCAYIGKRKAMRNTRCCFLPK